MVDKPRKERLTDDELLDKAAEGLADIFFKQLFTGKISIDKKAEYEHK